MQLKLIDGEHRWVSIARIVAWLLNKPLPKDEKWCKDLGDEDIEVFKAMPAEVKQFFELFAKGG